MINPVIPYQEWLNKKCSLDELLLLSIKENPHDKDLDFFVSIDLFDSNTYETRRDESERWINTLELYADDGPDDSPGEFYNIDPFLFFTLAIKAQWALPQPIRDFLNKRQSRKDETVRQFDTTTAAIDPPCEKKGGYEDRDNDFILWREEKKPDLDSITKKDIYKLLAQRNPSLWTSGFVDWWKHQPFIKKKPGRKSG